jgi:hypothetical protein
MTFPIFSAGEVLRATDMNAVGLWKVASGTLSVTTSGTNLTGVFGANYKQYRILLNYTGRSTTNRVDIRYLVGTTPTGSGYYQAGIASDFASNTTLYMQRSNNDPLLYGISTASGQLSASFDIFNANKADVTMHQGHMNDRNSGYVYSFGGLQTSATAFTGMQFLTNVGTATVEYQVFGYQN